MPGYFVLWWLRQRSTCGSGRAREAGDAVYGTGFAGVRGSTPRLARTHNSYSERAIPSCENIPVTFT